MLNHNCSLLWHLHNKLQLIRASRCGCTRDTRGANCTTTCVLNSLSQQEIFREYVNITWFCTHLCGCNLWIFSPISILKITLAEQQRPIGTFLPFIVFSTTFFPTRHHDSSVFEHVFFIRLLERSLFETIVSRALCAELWQVVSMKRPQDLSSAPGSQWHHWYWLILRRYFNNISSSSIIITCSPETWLTWRSCYWLIRMCLQQISFIVCTKFNHQKTQDL